MWDRRLQIQNLFVIALLGQQYYIGEKPTVMLYSAIDPYTIRAYSLEHRQCFNILINKERYAYILQVRRDILRRI